MLPLRKHWKLETPSTLIIPYRVSTFKKKKDFLLKTEFKLSSTTKTDYILAIACLVIYTTTRLLWLSNTDMCSKDTEV